MSYSFKRFEENNTKHETRISLTKSYNIGFPTAFYKQNDIDKYDYAILFYDSEAKAIAIYLTNESKERGRFRVSRDKNGMGATISATSFLRGNNIDPKVYYGKYEWKKDFIPDVGKVYVIELKANT